VSGTDVTPRRSGLGWPSAGGRGPAAEPAFGVGTGGLGWPGREPEPSDPKPVAHTRHSTVDGDVSRETVASTEPPDPRVVDRGETGSAADSNVMPASALDLLDPRTVPTPAPPAQTGAILGSRERLPRPARTRMVTIANQKGGVGKTTSTVNLAAGLAMYGAEVLVLDLDPQGNASTALGVQHHAETPSIYGALIEGRPLIDIVQNAPGLPGLSCAPATIHLAGAEIELVSLVARESRLARALRAYARDRAVRNEPRLDYVLIDCPPSLGLLTVNAFVAAEEVLVPIQCEYYALEGLQQLLSNVDLIRDHLNPDLVVSTMLLTMYDARTRLAAEVANDVRTHFPKQVLKAVIPRSVRVSEAPSFGQTVMTYDPSSSGALSYFEAAKELAGRGETEEQS
jgi:chromosome partitioning protein